MSFIDYILALLHDPRSFIADWINTLGPIWTYGPLWAIIFLETGLVICPFLPGDSLLFCAGVFANSQLIAAGGSGTEFSQSLETLPYTLNIAWLIGLMSTAAIIGNTSNYWIGRKLGEQIIKSGKVRWLSEKNIVKVEAQFNKYGFLAVVVTRFFPIIRTIAPFMAGVSRMQFGKFSLFNVIGAVLWVSIFTLLGYFFGNLPIVAENFELVIVAILLVSFLPIIVGAIRAAARRASSTTLK